MPRRLPRPVDFDTGTPAGPMPENKPFIGPTDVVLQPGRSVQFAKSRRGSPQKCMERFAEKGRFANETSWIGSWHRTCTLRGVRQCSMDLSLSRVSQFDGEHMTKGFQERVNTGPTN